VISVFIFGKNLSILVTQKNGGENDTKDTCITMFPESSIVFDLQAKKQREYIGFSVHRQHVPMQYSSHVSFKDFPKSWYCEDFIAR
jgi:hypothetical protein